MLYICFYFLKKRMDKKSEEFYKRLKQELTDSTLWPAEYLFKFIVPSEPEKIKEIENAFNQMGAVIETNQSKTGRPNQSESEKFSNGTTDNR